MDLDFALSVSAALDPVLVPEGFAAGQCGDTQAIYCAGHDELSDRFPALPQSNAQVRGRGCCIDLVVDLAGDGVHVSLEGLPLTETLLAVQLYDDAAVAKHLVAAARAPLAAVRERLAALDAWSVEAVHGALQATAEALGIGLGKIAQPLRVAITGTQVSPSIDHTVHLAGRDPALARIDAALAKIAD